MRKNNSYCESIPTPIKLLIYWFAFVFFSTETLSVLGVLTSKNIVIADVSFFVFLMAFFRERLLPYLRVPLKFNGVTVLVAALLLLTFVQGASSAPNTADSMVYHIPRVMYWLQEGTLAQPFIRNFHDFMPPFAEYLLLHLYALGGGDRFLFLSQWTAFAFSIYLSVLISRQLMVKDASIKKATLMVVALPIAVLQATSTQVDLITNVMVLLSLYLVISMRGKISEEKLIFLAMVASLGALTKPTFIVFLIMPAGYFIRKLYRREIFLNFKTVVVSVSVFLALQLRYYLQNIKLFGNILGYGGLYTTPDINIASWISNLLKNVLMNLPMPFFSYRLMDFFCLIQRHIGFNINDPAYSYWMFKPILLVYPQEDIAANPLHLLLIFIAGIVLVFNTRVRRLINEDLKVLFLLVVVTFMIFSAFVQWTPFHLRLLIPLLIIGTITSVPIVAAINKFWEKSVFVLTVLSVILAFIMILFNVSKPYIGYWRFYGYIKQFVPENVNIPSAFYEKPRLSQYFYGRNYWEQPYTVVLSKIKNRSIRISFDLMDGFEYPLWVLLKNFKINAKVIPTDQVVVGDYVFYTGKDPLNGVSDSSDCIKTDIDYGYACLIEKK